MTEERLRIIELRHEDGASLTRWDVHDLLAEVRRLRSIVHAAREEIRRGSHVQDDGAIKFGATEVFNAYRLLIDAADSEEVPCD